MVILIIQIEQQCGEEPAQEMNRIPAGASSPLCMRKAVGSPISIDPLLTATSEALEALQK